MRISGRTFALLMSVLLASLSLLSCDSPSTTSPPSNDMTLKVAQNTNSISFFPFYVAEQEHFIQAQGLTLNPSPPPVLGTGPKLTAALEAGSIEVAAGSVTDAFTLARVDAYVKIIGSFANDFFLDIIVSKRFLASTHITANSALGDKVKALIGKKIGISSPGSTNDALVTYLFRQQGLDAQKDITRVNLGNNDPTAGLGALARGSIDALAFPIPVGQFAEARGIGTIFISPIRGDVPDMQGQLYGVLYARQPVIATKSRAVQAFIRALAQAEAWLHKNPTQAIALLMKYLKQDQKTANAIFAATLPGMPQSPQVSQQGYATADQFHAKAGLIAVQLSYNLVDSATIDAALRGLPASS